MKTTQIFFENRNEVKIWFEDVNGKLVFWKKINGISYSITERQYLNAVKKNDLKNILLEYK